MEESSITYPLSRLIRNSGPMLVGFLANSVSAFVVFMILLNNLSVTEYGLIVLFSTTIALLELIGSGGLPGALESKYHRYLEDNQMDLLLSASFALSWAFIIIISILTYLFSFLYNPFEGAEFISPFTLVALACVVSFFSSHVRIGESLLKISEKTSGIAKISLMSSIMSLIIAYISIIHFQLGIEGALLTVVLTKVAIGIIYSSVVFRRISRFTINLREAKHIAVIGFPLMLTSLSSTMTNLGDRFVIDSMMEVSDVGVYNAGYQFFTIAILLGLVVINGWMPIFFEDMSNDSEKKDIFSDFAFFGSSIGSIGFLIFMTLFYFAQDSVFPEDYPEAPLVFYIVAAGAIPVLIHNLNYLRMLRLGRTKTILATSLMISFANIGLNVALIPFLGLKGAALATLITNILSPFMSHFLAKNHDQIAIKNAWGILLNCSVIAVACALTFMAPSESYVLLTYLVLCMIPVRLLSKKTLPVLKI